MPTIYRVSCPDHFTKPTTLPVATRALADIEKRGFCNQFHQLEVNAGGGWVPVYVHQARKILAAPVSPTPIPLPDGPLVKFHGWWSPETCQAVEALAEPGSDNWATLMGSHEYAKLSADGREVRADGFCRCDPQPPVDVWVRYERWSARGREAHGYVCATCRFVTQTG